MNTHKKILILGIVLIFLVFAFVGKSFLTAQLTEIEGISSEDYSYEGENVEIQGEVMACKEGFENCKMQITPTGGEAINLELTRGANYNPISGKISVIESGARFKIGDETFSNIDSGNIILDQKTGEISQAKFTTNSEGGNYNINGNKFNVPGNKEFIYPSEEGGYKLPGGAEVLEAQPGIQIETLENEIIKYKGNDVSGVLNFDKEGNAFVKTGESATINGITLRAIGHPTRTVSDTYIFLDKKIAEASNYVVFGEKDFTINGQGDSFEVSFNENNPYIEMKTGDYLAFTSGGSDKGEIIIKEHGNFQLPTIEVKGKSAIHTDSIRFDPEGESEKLLVKEIANIGGPVSFASVHYLGDGKQIRSFSLPGQGIYFDPVEGGEIVFYNKNHEKIETNLLAVSNPDLEKYFPEDMRLIYNPADLASNQNYLSNLKDYSSAGKRVDNFLKQNKPTYENLYGTRFGTTQGNQILQQASQIYSGFEIHRDPQKITQEIQTYTQSLRNQGILNPNEDLPSFDISNSLGYNQFNSDLNILESVGNIFVSQGFMGSDNLISFTGENDPNAKRYGIRYYNFKFNKPTSTDVYKANLGQY